MGFFSSRKKEAAPTVELSSEQLSFERARLNDEYRALAEEAVLRVRRMVEEPLEGWEIWEEKGGLKIEKNSKTNISGTICGRGTMTWTVDQSADKNESDSSELKHSIVNMDALEEFLWDDNKKSV